MSNEYKLLPEIKNFILDYKRTHLEVSCRKLCLIIQDKFQAKISKSSINAVIKEAGLSDKIGRKSLKEKPTATKITPQMIPPALPETKFQALPKPAPLPSPEAIPMPESIPESELKPEPLPESKPEPEIIPQPEPAPEPQPELPAQPEPILEPVEIKPAKETGEAGFYIFQAADLALGGLSYILELCQAPGENEKQTSEIYSALAKGIFTKDIGALKKYPEVPLSGDVSESLKLISQQLPMKSEEVRSFKITLEDNRTFYVDTEFNSLWPTTNIAHDFCANIDWAKAAMNDRLKNKGMVLLTAPRDLRQLDSLFSWMNVPTKKIELLGEGNRVLSAIDDRILSERNFIFAVLPGQLEKELKITSSKEALNFFFEPFGEEFQVTESQVELTGGFIYAKTHLRILALKRPGSSRPFIHLCTNSSPETSDAKDVVLKFLLFWPDPLFALNDFDKKNELFAYALERKLPAYPAYPSLNWENILAFWNNCLNIYCLRYISPPDEEIRSLAQIKERFYDLKAQVQAQADYSMVRFILPEKYAFRKELEYAIKRLNQKCLFDLNNRRLWFSI